MDNTEVKDISNEAVTPKEDVAVQKQDVKISEANAVTVSEANTATVLEKSLSPEAVPALSASQSIKKNEPLLTDADGDRRDVLLKRMKRQLRVNRIVTWMVILVCIALGGALMVFLLKKDEEKKPENTKTVTIENRFLDAQAAEHVKQYSGANCTASIEEILGWQYVSLEYENGFSIKVRNEYPREATEREAMAVLLMNESGMREGRTDISMDTIWTIAETEPLYFGEKPYLFFRHEDGTYGFINMTTLAEAVSVKPADVVASYFTLEDIGDEHVTVLAGKNEYVFHSTHHSVSFQQMQIVEDNGIVTISTPVGLGEGEYIGYLDGVMLPEGDAFVLKEVKFGAYVGMDYEDPKSTKIIEPSAEVLENPIVLSGNGRYYLPRFQNVPFHTYNWDNMVFEENGFRTLYDDNGNRISKMGIDVSKYNKEIDWEAVKKAGIEFAIVRAGFRGVSQGTVEEDPYAEANFLGALEAGMDVGTYFYTQAITEAEAIEEAEFVIGKLQEYGVNPTMPIVIDTELYETKDSARGNGLSREERTKCLKAFCKTVEEAGYRPMVYASTRWSVLNYNRDELAEYPFWFAYYGDKVSYRFDFDIWQYTSEGTVPGIEGGVDLNIMLDLSVIEKK